MKFKFKLNIVEILSLILVTLIGVSFYLIGTPEYSKDKVVVAFGDSLTVGYGINPPFKNYVSYLSEKTGILIINSGKSGDTTADALVRLKEDVLDYNPDVVMILLGGNDYFRNYSDEVIEVNVRTMIQNIKKSRAKIILIGGSRQVAPHVEEVAERIVFDGLVDGYVPDVLGGIFLRKDLMYDGAHPNDRGHKIIADRILPVLESVLSKLN
ncbi:hypothetical protein GW950_01135 [Candidatus Wolfebacteria bacterium]|nr:hypothetical protein [Candidatus Wolfebacteria bacterium]